MMSINMRLLTPDTYLALQEISDKRQWPDVHGWIEPEQAAWLTFRLAYVPDAEFARGKWATIQRLQQMLDDYAAKELK